MTRARGTASLHLLRADNIPSVSLDGALYSSKFSILLVGQDSGTFGAGIFALAWAWWVGSGWAWDRDGRGQDVFGAVAWSDIVFHPHNNNNTPTCMCLPYHTMVSG